MFVLLYHRGLSVPKLQGHIEVFGLVINLSVLLRLKFWGWLQERWPSFLHLTLIFNEMLCVFILRASFWGQGIGISPFGLFIISTNRRMVELGCHVSVVRVELFIIRLLILDERRLNLKINHNRRCLNLEILDWSTILGSKSEELIRVLFKFHFYFRILR